MTLPMPTPVVPPLPLTEYKILSFDIYGTLIEYKANILQSFHPLLSRLPQTSPYLDKTLLSETIPGSSTKGSVEFLKLFQKQEDAIKLETPVRRFDEILTEIWKRIASELGVETSDQEVLHFGSQENIASWVTFPGTVEALKSLSQRYKLVALSNIDAYAWDITKQASGLGDVEWMKVFTAEDFGDDLKRADAVKLETLIQFAESKGYQKKEVLHVAQSLGHDHAPAKKLELSSVFLVGDGPVWGKEAESKMAIEKDLVGYAWRFPNLKSFADEVEKEFNKQ